MIFGLETSGAIFGLVRPEKYIERASLCLGSLVLPLALVDEPAILIVPPVLKHTLTLRHWWGGNDDDMSPQLEGIEIC